MPEMAVYHVAGGTAWAVRPAARPAPRGRAGFRGTLRSEFTKIRSTRSTYWTLLALVVITIAIGALASFAAAHNVDSSGPYFDPTNRSLDGLYLGQLVIAALGAVTITSEYSTGMISTSLIAMPRRGVVFAAKATAFGVVAFVTGLVTCFAAFFLGQALMSAPHINATLGQPNVLRAVIGGALYLTVCGLLAFGLGMILRHTAGAITASIALLFVLPLLVTLLPQSWQNNVNKWVPTYAGGRDLRHQAGPHGPGRVAPVLAVDWVRSVRDLRGDRADRRDGGVPQARRVTVAPGQVAPGRLDSRSRRPAKVRFYDL